MKAKLTLTLLLILLSFVLPAHAQGKGGDMAAPSSVPVGGYDITFNLSNATRRMTFLLMSDGTGIFRVIGPRTTIQPPAAIPAVWSKPTPFQISFSGEVQFPVSNCCRETGTLVFKASLIAATPTITGRVIYVTDVPDPNDPTGFVVKTGTFTAVPVPVIARP